MIFGPFQLPDFWEPFLPLCGFWRRAGSPFPTKYRLKRVRPESPLQLLLGSRRGSGRCVLSLCCSNLCSYPVFVGLFFFLVLLFFFLFVFLFLLLVWLVFVLFLLLWCLFGFAIPPKRHFPCSFRGFYPFSLPKFLFQNPLFSLFLLLVLLGSLFL